jgi:hypothetical protein
VVVIRNKRNFEDLLCKALEKGLSSLGEFPKQKISESEANFLESLIMKFLFEEVGQTVHLNALMFQIQAEFSEQSKETGECPLNGS